MADVHIIPIRHASGKGPIVVLEVRGNGPDPLDRLLSASDGEDPYVTEIKQRNIEKLKRKFKGSNEEWTAILSYFLLGKQPEPEHAKSLDDIGMVYVLAGDVLQIIIRRDIKGIKMTLGEIPLPKDEEYEIEPFQWAQTAAVEHAEAVKELAELRSKVKDSQNMIDQLSKQMEEFLTAKRQTEVEMLEKFKVLLNEKKRKIRDQQRLLATAKVDKTTAKAVKAAEEELAKPRKPGPSRTSKRKAAVKTPPVESESDQDKMAVDQGDGSGGSEDEAEVATPDQNTEDETEDEDADLEPTRSVPQSKGKPAASTQATAKVTQDTRARPEPPPRRELPFHRPATRSHPPETTPAPAAEAEDDDETEEEEL